MAGQGGGAVAGGRGGAGGTAGESWLRVATARAPGGGALELWRRGDAVSIRVDGQELMASAAHRSEDELARLGCRGCRAGARVLVGGLGLGYTLRAALDALPPDATVVVAELVPAVVEWSRGELVGALAGRPLDDPRVRVEVADVGAVLRRTTVRWDAILLDVDNGPTAMTRRANHALYIDAGLTVARRALRAGGRLAVWSAARAPEFARRLERARFRVSVHPAPAGPAGGARHVIYLGELEGA